MIKYFSPYFVILSCLTHLFCCGIPFFLSITSFGSVIGLTSFSLFNFSWFEEIEVYLFSITTLVLLFSVISEINSRRIDCLKDGLCDHDSCEPKKKFIRLNLSIAIVLYFLNFLVFYSEVLLG